MLTKTQLSHKLYDLHLFCQDLVRESCTEEEINSVKELKEVFHE